MKKRVESMNKFEENFMIMEVFGEDEDDLTLQKMSGYIVEKICSEGNNETKKCYLKLIKNQLMAKKDFIIAEQEDVTYLRLNGMNKKGFKFVDMFIVNYWKTRSSSFISPIADSQKIYDIIFRICKELSTRYPNTDIDIAVQKNIFCKRTNHISACDWNIVNRILQTMEYVFRPNLKFVVYNCTEKAVPAKTRHTEEKLPCAWSIHHISDILGFGDNILSLENCNYSDVGFANHSDMEMLCEITLPSGNNVPVVMCGETQIKKHKLIETSSVQVTAIPVKIKKVDTTDGSICTETNISCPDKILFILNPERFESYEVEDLAGELELFKTGAKSTGEQIKLKLSDGNLNSVVGVKHMRILSILHAPFPKYQIVSKTIHDEIHIKNMIHQNTINSIENLGFTKPTTLELNDDIILVMGTKYHKLHSSKPSLINELSKYEHSCRFTIKEIVSSRYVFHKIDVNGLLPSKWIGNSDNELIIASNNIDVILRDSIEIPMKMLGITSSYDEINTPIEDCDISDWAGL